MRHSSLDQPLAAIYNSSLDNNTNNTKMKKMLANKNNNRIILRHMALENLVNSNGGNNSTSNNTSGLSANVSKTNLLHQHQKSPSSSVNMQSLKKNMIQGL
jgi:hypothetical protein